MNNNEVINRDEFIDDKNSEIELSYIESKVNEAEIKVFELSQKIDSQSESISLLHNIMIGIIFVMGITIITMVIDEFRENSTEYKELIGKQKSNDFYIIPIK